MKFPVFAAFLFSIGWMSVEVAGQDREASCCLTVSETRIPHENIVNYTRQDNTICPIRAVRFHTVKNITICSDPNNNWAKRVMAIVDKRRATKPSPTPTTCYTSTTKVIPTTATTDKTLGTETETSTSTTLTPAVTTIKTSETETSTSTAVPTTVTTVRPSTLETKISKTTILPTSMSKEKPESTATTCGTGEPTAPPTETKPKIPGVGTVAPLKTFTAKNNIVITTAQHDISKRTKPSKLKIKILLKNSKKGLRRVQTNLKKKSG